MAHKHLFTKESVRDPVDVLRSLYIWPGLVLYDDACGLANFLVGNYPTEAHRLFGDRRGCFETWSREPPTKVQDFKIPEL